MAKVKLTKGSITIQRGMNPDDGTPIFAITTAFNPRIHLGGDHHMPIPMADRDVRLLDHQLTPEGQKALVAVVLEIEAIITKTAHEKAKKFAEETGFKLEG